MGSATKTLLNFIGHFEFQVGQDGATGLATSTSTVSGIISMNDADDKKTEPQVVFAPPT